MLVIMLSALGGTLIANTRTQFEHFTQHLFIRSGASDRELSRGLAYVGAIEADADTLPHVHLFCSAGVGATKAHAGTVHEVVRRIA